MNWPREITWGGERGSYWNERDCVKTYAEFACSYLVQDLCCSSEYISCRITKYQSKIVKFHAFQHCWVLAFNRYTLEYSLETCNECGKSFKETGNLKIHKMILSLHVLSILIWVVTWNNIRLFTSKSKRTFWWICRISRASYKSNFNRLFNNIAKVVLRVIAFCPV